MILTENGYTYNPTNPSEIITAGEFDVHTMANIVPLDPKTDTLEASIDRTGLLQPIMLYKGRIIDGRRRAISCARLGITPAVNDIGIERDDRTDKELYEIVLAANNRRNINKGQKAIIAAFQTSAKAHVLMGYKTALEYAKTVWDISPVSYKKAKYIVDNSKEFAVEIFSNGFAEIDGKQCSMSRTWQHLKAQASEVISTSRIPGEQGIAIAYDMIKPMTASLLQVADSDSVIKALTMMQNDIRDRAEKV